RQQPAGLRARQVAELEPDRRASAGHAVDRQRAAHRGAPALEREARDDQLAGVGVVDAHAGFGAARRGHQPLVDREGPDRRRHVAAVARIVDRRLRHRHLRERVVDIGPGMRRRADHAHLGQRSQPASHAVELAPGRVGRAHRSQEDRRPAPPLGRQIALVEHQRLRRAASHEDGIQWSQRHRPAPLPEARARAPPREPLRAFAYGRILEDTIVPVNRASRASATAMSNSPADPGSAATAPVDTPALARELSQFACRMRTAPLPAEVRELATRHILDALGIGLASHAQSYAAPALAGIEAAGSNGPCTVIGDTRRLSPRDAALANGLLMHGLDYDDTHLASIIHPTVASLPAALAVGEALDATWEQLLSAYAVGVEAAIRIGAAADGGFHHVGFHATGVVSHFSAALAAGSLLGLDEHALTMAQGIAASTASGVQVFLEEGA